MIDQFFGSAMVKNPSSAMCADTDNIHINHLVKMNHSVLNVLVIDYMTIVIYNIIHFGKPVHR